MQTHALERLTLDHARPLERFERANRAFFAARVGDRGDDYFEHFDDQLAARLVENQEARPCSSSLSTPTARSWLG